MAGVAPEGSQFDARQYASKMNELTPQSVMDQIMHYPDTSEIVQLPDDVLLHIVSFLTNLKEMARTSILSHRWKDLWLYTSRLDFDAIPVLPMDRLETSHDWYIEWVNKVMNARAALYGLPCVKELFICYELDASQSCHIDRWVTFAIVNQVETLHLELSPYSGLLSPEEQYILSAEFWHRVPSGLSSLKCLKSLHLSCVNVSKEFIEFILSSCPLLEDMLLYHAGAYDDLDVSSVDPLHLRRLKIVTSKDYALTKLCAPYLTSFHYRGRIFNPRMIDVPMLTDLTIGGASHSQHIMEYLEHFWIYLPQLEKLDLIMFGAEDFRLKEMTALVQLKYLKIRVFSDSNPIYHQLIDFINACPLLETFALEILSKRANLDRPSIQRRRRSKEQECDRTKKSCFKCLKVVELYAGGGKPIDQEIIAFIINNSPRLEKLIVDVRSETRYPNLQCPEPEIAGIVKAKAEKLCQVSGREIEIRVIGG